MFRTHIPVFTLSAAISFFAACGGDSDGGECAVCGEFGGGAVKCYPGLGPPQTICAADQDLAAVQCLEGGGSYSPLPVCAPDGGETGGDAGSAPWSPSRDITLDPGSGQYVIDQIAFEELKLDPGPLFLDTSELREIESGFFQVANAGELSDALGWQAGDVLLAVSGHGLQGMAEFAAAFTALEGRDAVRADGLAWTR